MSARTMTRHLAIGVAVATLPLVLLASRPPVERVHVGGSVTMTYIQQHQFPVTDAEGHALLADEAKGTNRSTGPTSYMDGAEVRSVELADLVQGTGSHQGYITFSQKGEEHVSKWSGKVTTVLGPDKKPWTTFKGTWTKVKGPSGKGTYRGQMTAPNAYTVEWEGELESARRAASR